jgi:hypothetical protein
MTTTTSPLTAPARRSFLALLTGAAAAAPAIALAAAATEPPTPIPPPEESPELLALGDQITAAIGEMRTAQAMKAEAAALYERTKPTLPNEIVWSSAHPLDREMIRRDLALAEIDIQPTQQMIYDSRAVRAQIILQDHSRHTKEGKRLRRIARLAKGYEDARGAAEVACGYYDHEQEARRAAVRAANLTNKLAIEKLEPTGARGLLIYAAALREMPDVMAETGRAHISSPAERCLADVIARGLARLIGGAA